MSDADFVDELRRKLASALAEGVTEETIAKAKKQLENLCYGVIEDVGWKLKDDLAENLAWQVHQWTRRAIEAMLDGNEDLFRRYLHAEKDGFTGRGKGHVGADGKPFEYGCTVWRRKLVDAFPEILKNERILDLEDQVKRQAEHIQNLQQQNEQLRERLRWAS